MSAQGLETLEPRLLFDADPSVLFVVGNTALNNADAEIHQRLLDLDFSITLADDDASGALSGDGYDLVVVSSTVTSGKVGSAFTHTSAGVLTWETYLYDDLGMTGTGLGVDYGYVAGIDDVTVLEPGHPLAGSQSGTLHVSNSQPEMAFGVPNANAVHVAGVAGQPGRASVFAYDTGAGLFGFEAPARRVGMFMDNTSAAGFSSEGQALFDAAVNWSVGREVQPPSDPGLVILPLGDSITRAKFDFLSYRYYLWQGLLDAGVNFDFVGEEKTNGGYTPDWPDHMGHAFDPDHEGHGGFRVDQINAALPGYLTGYTPDIALVHLGTNDILQGQPATSTAEELRATIALLRQDNPDVTILLSQIIPLDTSQAQAQAVNELNALVPVLAADLSTAQSPIIVVDQHTGFDAASDLYDAIHPDHEGEQMIAQRFYNALDALLHGNAAPTAEAGPDQTRDDADENASEPFTLDATSSADPDGTLAHYIWSIDGTPIATGAQPTVELGVGTHTVVLSVVDHDGAVAQDSVTLTVTGPVVTPPQALLVVGKPTLEAGDTALRDRLMALGFEVEVVLDDLSETADASGKDLVFISATVNSGKVGTKFTHVSSAVIAGESYVFDDLGMTGGVAGTDFGSATGSTSVEITDAGHALSGGLSAGAVSIAGSTDHVRWGRPVGGDAVVVASLVGDPTRATVFGYEAGAALNGLTASGRRVALFLDDDTAASWTPAGQSLFDAAVLWAIA